MDQSSNNHVVYWTIPMIDGDGKVVCERHFAVNLAELDRAEAEAIESMLTSHRAVRVRASSVRGEPGGPTPEAVDPRDLRTDPRITQYRQLFKPFVEVKKRAVDLCRFSMVRLPFYYAEYAHADAEPRHHAHPSVRPLAGAG